MKYKIRTIGVSVGNWEEFKLSEFDYWIANWVNKGLGSIEIKKEVV